MTSKQKDPRRSGGKKKPYRKPELSVHGDIRAITQSKGSHSNDGTGKPATKAPTGPGT
jgi:hypothetical protein